MSGSTAELRILITSKDSASQAIKGLGQNLGGLGIAGKVATAALTGIAVAGGALVAGIGGAVSTALDFESAMSAVGAVAGASGSELAALSQTALQLGQDTSLAGISASDAAKAMAELASGGVSVADIMGGAARGALLLASAGGIDVARAAEIAAAALNNFGLAGSETGHIADLFAAAANSSAVSVSDLGESLKYIGPLASSMGLSIEEVTAALAEFGDQGIKGSQAGTSLRSILSSLAKPSKQASGLIKELGLEFFDAGGHMKSIAGISEQLKTKLGGLTDEQRANALVTLFGNEALSAATVLYGEGAAGIEKYLAQVNVAGSAAANGAKRNDNLRGSIEQLKSSWETLSIVVGTAFIPVIRRAVDGLSGVINKILSLKDAIGPAIQAIIKGFASGDFTNAFGPILAVLDKVFGEGTSAKVALFVSNILTFVQSLRNGIVAFAGGIASGFGAVAGAIASLLTGQTTLAQFVGGMEIFVTTVLGNLGKLASQAAPHLAAFFSVIGSFIAAAAPQIAAQTQLWAASFVDWIQTTALPWLIPRLQLLLAAIGTWITGTALPAIGAWLVGVGQAFGTWVTATAIPFLQLNLPLWLAALGTWLQGTALPAVGGFLGGIASAFGTWVSTTAVPFLQANLPVWLAALGSWITGTAAPAVAGFMGAVASAMGTWVSESAIPWLQLKLPEWTAAYLSWAESTGRPAVIAAMKDFGKAMGDWIVNDAIPWVQNELPKWQAAVREWIIGTALPAIGAALLVVGQAFGTWVTETAIPYVVQHLPGWIAAITGWLLGTAIPAVVSALHTFALEFGNWVVTKAIPFVTEKLPEWERAVSTWIVGTAIPAIVATLLKMGEAFGDWVTTKAVPWLLAKIPEWKDAIVNYLLGTALPAIQAEATKLGTALVDKFMEEAQKLKDKVFAEMALVPGRIKAGLGDLASLLVSAGADLIRGLIAGIQSMAGAVLDAARRLAEAVAATIRNALKTKSPSRVTMEIGRQIVAGLIVGIDQKQDEAVKKAADLASSVAKAVIDTLSAMKTLAGFDFAKNTPTGAQLGGFAAFVANTTAMIAQIGAQFSEKALKAAGEFADAANKVVGLIGNGVKGLMALADFVPPADAAIYAFGKSLRSLINDISLLAEQVTQGAVEQAAAFAEGAGKVVAILGSGVAGFTALIDFVAPPVAAIYAFGKALRIIINDIALLSEQVTQEAVNQAAAFAEGAGKVVGILGTGVAGFAALADFVAPATSAVFAFGKSLRSIINDFALLAEQITQDAVEQAALFAEGAGKVIAIIGNGVEGFTKLLTFVAPSQQAIHDFVYAVFEAVRKIAEMASQMSTEGVEMAGAFGTAANSVLGALKTGLDVFTGLAKLVVPSAKAIDDFAIAIAYTVSRIGTIADQLGRDGIKRATEFGASVQTIFGSLKSSMDILTNLEKFKDVAAKAFDSLLAGLVGAKERAEGMVSQAKDLVLLSEEYLANMTKAAANFAKGQSLGTVSGEEIGRSLGEGIASGAQTALDSHSPSEVMAAIGRDVVAGLVQGMSDAQQDAAKKAADVASAVAKAITDTLGAATALGNLDLRTLPTGGQVGGILGFTRALVAEMAASSTMLSEDGAKATNLFADTASKVASAVNAGIAALTSLVSFIAPASRAIFDFGKSLRTAVMDLAALADEIGVALAEKAALFSEQATKAIAVFGSGVAGFTSLIGYVRPASKAIYDFGKDLMLALGDLAAIVDEVGQELADKAGKFGEVTSKSVAVIGAGAEAFKKLADYTRIPSKAIYDFGKDLMALIADFAAIVDLIGVEVAEKAGKFADGAGKAVTVVGTALGSFAGLATFVTPGKAAVDGLLATIRYIVARFGEMAAVMSTEGTKQLGDFGAATNAVLGGVKAAIDTFIALDKAVVPRTGDLSDLVLAVQGVTQNMASAAKLLGDDAIEDATAFGTAANGIFSALKSGLDLFILIDKPGSWPTTDWLQPLIELMAGVLLRGGQLLTQSQQLKAIADQFSANLMQAGATFGGALGLGDWALTGNVGGSGLAGGGGGTVINNYYTVTGNTLLSKDTGTQQMVSGIVTATRARTISYSTSG